MAGPAPLPLEEAQARLLALATPLPIERVDPVMALGRYLAEPLLARRTQPAAHASAMDGYAVRAVDLPGPWRLVGESAAGHPCPLPIGPGQTVRISTGALLPTGADTVILQEDINRSGDTVTFTGGGPLSAGRHVRHEGSDFWRDSRLLQGGTRIGPAQIALAIAAGHFELSVRRRPRLAIIDSGDELSRDPDKCAVHQIPASNGAMLAALASSFQVDVQRIGPVDDDLSALIAAFEEAQGTDVIVTTGGASVGDHDLIRPALEQWGARLEFWKVAIKPGKPLLVARRGEQIILGLPGNPVSGMVTAYLFLLPLLRALLGASNPLPRALVQKLASPLPPIGDRREFMRARLTAKGLDPVSTQDSGALAALAATDMLIDRAAGSPALTAGSEVSAYLVENGGIA